MTQENKNLLLKDLCGRLPYGVKIQVNDRVETLEGIGILDNVAEYGSFLSCDIEEIKPYLFPLSSMIENLRNEYQDKRVELELKALNNEIEYEEVTTFEVDFYLKNHFDYRGLIPMGLAIDATGLNIY